MQHKHADVLAIVSATRPAQTAERVTNALNLKRARAGLSRVSAATVRTSLTHLASQGELVRLTGDDAAACGAFPHQYKANTAFWISADNYRTYHPGAELPAVPDAPPARQRPSKPAPAATPAAHTPPREQAEPSIRKATLGGLDQLRRHIQTDLTTLASLENRTAAEDALAASLITLMDQLGTARWSFVSGSASASTAATPTPASSAPMPQFLAQG